MLTIPSVEALVQRLQEDGVLRDTVLHGLDLEPIDPILAGRFGPGCVLLGCRLSAARLAEVVAAGGVVFPPLPDLPYEPYRARLYTVDELMTGFIRGQPESFRTSTLDSRIYAHFSATRGGVVPPVEALAQRLHDHAMDVALSDYLTTRAPRVVGIMGGHDMRRDAPAYARVVRIAYDLGRAGYEVATGGGPGAMEAGNLGAWLAPFGPDALGEALALLSPVPSWRDPRWFETALAVRDRFPGGAESIAVPTWYYGHEPSNLFSTHVAKYFANSIREDVLVSIAVHGILYTPGSAGTIQEIFADATQNHYGTVRSVSPMVFLDSDFWTTSLPVLPLLERLAGFRRYRAMVTLADDPADVVAFFLSHPPRPFDG